MRLRFILAVLFAFVVCNPCLSQSARTLAENVRSATIDGSPVPFRRYHDHSVRDIDAIGDRNVGCGRGFGNWYSVQRQMAMGQQYAAQVEATSDLVKDPTVNEYINRIGQNLVRNSDSLVPFRIKVIDSDDVNAVTLPGGFLYIDSGLILAADDEAELAGVMAHEIAHVAACHAAREKTRSQLLNFSAIPLMLIGGPAGYLGYEGLTVATPLAIMKFSRKFEAQADYLGVQYMYKAGYDPEGMVDFFEKIKAMETHKENAVARAFATHPQTPDRIAKTQREIERLLPPKAQYKVDTSDFEDVKARLYQSENRLRVGDESRPTLRRRMPRD